MPDRITRIDRQYLATPPPRICESGSVDTVIDVIPGQNTGSPRKQPVYVRLDGSGVCIDGGEHDWIRSVPFAFVCCGGVCGLLFEGMCTKTSQCSKCKIKTQRISH
ncbi:hypothetical protein BB558_003656 [Smittium angustum]|nr:hypothetical protein BB558_003656 [Smittium angustum]